MKGIRYTDEFKSEAVKQIPACRRTRERINPSMV